MSKLSASFVHAATCRARSATSNASTATLRMAEADVATALDASVAVAKDVFAAEDVAAAYVAVAAAAAYEDVAVWVEDESLTMMLSLLPPRLLLQLPMLMLLL